MASNGPHDPSPYWAASASFPRFAKLDRHEKADVVVVGGGITGLTAAYLLAAAGRSVIVLERGRCAEIDTGHTSAHLTMVTDARICELVERLGRTHAQATWDAGLAAIEQIEAIVLKHELDAGFARVDGYLHEPVGEPGASKAKTLKEDAALAADLGFDVSFMDEVPFAGAPGIRFDGQGRVHPRKYLAGLARAIVEMGGRIYEHSEAGDFTKRPLSIAVNGHSVSFADVVIATHSPLVGLGDSKEAGALQTRLALYTSYVIAAQAPRGIVPDALWWDTADPYQFVRVDPRHDHDVIVFGGEDHKTGQVSDTTACHQRLEQALTARVPGAVITHHWSGQVIETPDGLPFIGQTAEHQYSATGFSGNGLTFGTLSAMMISDAVLKRANPWTDLFALDRPAVRRGLWDYISENADYPYYRIRDRFAGAHGRDLRAVKRGQGQIIERDGAKVAVYRDENGVSTLRSAVCTHMGCIVAWNPAERTWDCPCHGSRFKPNGDVISGPAQSPLDKIT